MRKRAVVATMVLICAFGAAPAAAEVVVTTTADVSAAGDGECGLREAISVAAARSATADCPGVAVSGTTTIALAAGAYALGTTGLSLGPGADVALHGAGTATTTIGPATDRLLSVAAGASATLTDLTLTGGHAPVDGSGGAIRNSGTVVLTDIAIKDSRAGKGTAGADAAGGTPAGDGSPGGAGGALMNAGSATLTRVVFAGTEAGRGGAGGDGAASAGSGDDGGDGGDGGRGGAGGAIHNEGSLAMADVDIDLAVGGWGGAGGAGGSATTAGDSGAGGKGGAGGSGGDGGAISSVAGGTLTLEGATISAISGRGGRGGDGGSALSTAPAGAGGVGGASGSGGAVFVVGTGVTLSDLEVIDSDINGAGAGGDGGGSSMPGDGGAGGASGDGGGVAVGGGNVTIAGSSLREGRISSGGIGGAAGQGGGARGGHGGTGGSGGGLAVLDGQVTLTTTDIVENHAAAGGSARDGGGTGDAGLGGGIFAAADLTVTNTTIAKNYTGAPGALFGPDASGTTGASATGNAVAATGGLVALRFVTVAFNGSIDGGGAALYGVDDVQHSIIAYGGPGQCVGVGAGTGNFVWESGGGCPGAVDVDPQLGSFDYNGGLSATYVSSVPQPGSPAIDAAGTAGCPPIDQRGVPRPFGAACDAGAVEAIPAPTCPPLDVTTEAALTLTLSCTEPTGAAMAYWIASEPNNGTLEATSGTTLIYTPDPGFSGMDSFTYGASSFFGGDSGLATVTITVPVPTYVPVNPGNQGGPGRPTSPHDPTQILWPGPATNPPPPLPGIPPRPFSALSIKAKQKGSSVKGTLKLSSAGSRLDVLLTIRKPGKAKPITIGTLTAKRLKSGTYAFKAKLDRRRGLAALRRSRSLKVTVWVTVTPPTGATAVAKKTITLTR